MRDRLRESSVPPRLGPIARLASRERSWASRCAKPRAVPLATASLRETRCSSRTRGRLMCASPRTPLMGHVVSIDSPPIAGNAVCHGCSEVHGYCRIQEAAIDATLVSPRRSLSRRRSCRRTGRRMVGKCVRGLRRVCHVQDGELVRGEQPSACRHRRRRTGPPTVQRAMSARRRRSTRRRSRATPVPRVLRGARLLPNSRSDHRCDAHRLRCFDKRVTPRCALLGDETSVRTLDHRAGTICASSLVIVRRTTSRQNPRRRSSRFSTRNVSDPRCSNESCRRVGRSDSRFPNRRGRDPTVVRGRAQVDLGCVTSTTRVTPRVLFTRRVTHRTSRCAWFEPSAACASGSYGPR